MAYIFCPYQCTVAILPPPATSKRWRCDLLFLKIYNNIKGELLYCAESASLMWYLTMIKVFAPEMQLVKSSPFA